MKKTFLTVAILASTMTMATPSFAFSMGGLTSAVTGGGSGGGANLSASQTQTVADYAAGNLMVVNANIKMAQALHLDGEVSKLQATAESLKAGTSEDSLKNSDVTVSASTSSIVAELKTNPSMDEASKATFAAGLAELAAGALAYAKTGKDLADSQSAMSGASPMELLQLGELVYIAKSFPTNAKNFSNALTAGISYAKGQNIPVPANAADATSALGAF
jgi:hypothetical protein